MKFGDYIKETYDEGEFKSLTDKIKKECKPFFKYSRHNLLYRGIVTNDSMGMKRVRKDRKPKDMPMELHKRFDAAFKKKFGWGVRSEGLYCTGDSRIVKHYGKPCMVFPIGDFRFVWSKKVYDLWSELDIGLMTFKGLVLKLGLSRGDFVSDEDIDKLVSTYSDKNFVPAIKNGGEIAIECEKYYYLELGVFPVDTSKYDKLFY